MNTNIQNKTDKDRDELWGYLLETMIATENELQLITSINGFNLDSLESILYVRTGYRSLEQVLDYN
jgi:hypothetical protein